MKKKEVLIKNIIPESIAEEVGIEPGDSILSINGERIKDVFDYRFFTVNEYIVLEVQKKDGEIWEYEIEKDEYEDLGLEFCNPMMDESSSCTNKCIFCFIDQLPKGMRNTLYFKDDDSRLSFLMGNYITLTNMSFNDIDRIIRYRMSPINVSVHTTNPELREFMLNNRFAGDILEKIERIVKGGIEVNCQIVLCRGINDCAELDRTISDITKLYPGVRSISVVPVGITKYREGLYDLEPFDAESSMDVINQVEKWQDMLHNKFKSRIVYLSDEFYIMAKVNIPRYEHYEDFPQIENGVGLIAMLMHEFYEQLEYMEKNKDEYKSLLNGKDRIVSIATGVSSYKYIKQMVVELEKRYNNIKVNVFPIKNVFFGEHVTVTGLLTGGDIITQLSGKELGKALLISRCMLKSGEDVFLDDNTVENVQNQLDVEVTVVENSGQDFVRKILKIV